MNRIGDKKKRILFTVLVIILFLPLIQLNFKLIELTPLKGSFNTTKKVVFSSNNWKSKEFQNTYDKYFNENLGFRNLFVRLHNQIEYSFYNELNSERTVLGKDNVILEESYIFANYGLDYLGEEYINAQSEKIKYVQYKLKKEYNIDLLIVMAPSKVSFFEDKIPDKYNAFKNTEWQSKKILQST